ncbi:MAG: 30S ribosomal protein S8 [Gemmatimonadetes bacterium]|uniref:Small ribosomal subunit protein uS8 n=1 Tax=Candidatus Kutchimonas denitrificans TaxID=3056748 RepID=A0AAE5C7U9_9BACT|nr:30S ribosomal protein S8 [Gemmatimonadota bacterium]NIR73861.1 30S ribosomal protein S8 [Candidatus Kutchimonas denitrificans]NIR99667.1 30S ribosomal protein S8 [Gemmatimonadota bacterium]NIT65252.1 30S ribosomal protein S8 [Gemmatimonadota bacterium]NIW73701.1 30S ribosomal protein S8 [Gemmatimonadota bacterium]
MTMNDPIADLLTRVRNALSAGHRRVDVPLSRMKMEIARKLVDTHFIESVKVIDAGPHSRLRLYLKYAPDGRPAIREMRRVSRPGRRNYVDKSSIPNVRGGLGIAILSTSRGILTDREARAAGVGGELIAVVN